MFKIKRLTVYPGLQGKRPIRLTLTYPSDHELRETVYPVHSREGIKELEIYFSDTELIELSKELREAGF